MKIYGLSGAAFLGRPTGATLRICSITDGSYIALYDSGFIPSFSILLCAVFHGKLSSSAISSMVKPFMFAIVAYFSLFVDRVRYFTIQAYSGIQKKIKKIVIFRFLRLTIYRNIVFKSEQTAEVAKFGGVYCDQLQALFTQVTGLDTRL